MNNQITTTSESAIGFGSAAGFELMQRAARLLSSSTLVPASYRTVIEKLDRYGNVKERIENPSGLANCVVALNMANRMGADPLMVMQNLYIVEGRPSWSSQWIIAAINGCGRFSPLRFDIKVLGEKEMERTETYWANNERQTKVVKAKVADKVCVAWAIEKGTNERIESPPVSIEMAFKEGWYSKNGSKWQTMDEVMLRYRTASFFGKLYAPELLMGLQTAEELQDVIDITPEPLVVATAAAAPSGAAGAADAPAKPSAKSVLDSFAGAPAQTVTDVAEKVDEKLKADAPAQAQAQGDLISDGATDADGVVNVAPEMPEAIVLKWVQGQDWKDAWKWLSQTAPAITPEAAFALLQRHADILRAVSAAKRGYDKAVAELLDRIGADVTILEGGGA